MKVFIIAFYLAVACAPALAISSFSLPWMNASNGGSTNFTSNDHPGAIYVMESYFLTCPYCNNNAPHINDLATYYTGDPRVQIIDLGVDSSDSQYQQWIQMHQPNHPVLKDADQTVTGELGTQGYPTTYVLDSSLKVVYSHEGEFESGTMQEVKNAINRMLIRSARVCLAPQR